MNIDVWVRLRWALYIYFYFRNEDEVNGNRKGFGAIIIEIPISILKSKYKSRPILDGKKGIKATKAPTITLGNILK